VILIAGLVAAISFVATPNATASGVAITGASWETLQPGEGQFTLDWTPWSGTGVVVNDLYISQQSTTDAYGELSSNPEIIPIDPSTGSYTSYYTASLSGYYYFQLVIDAVSCGSGGSVGSCISNVFRLSTNGSSTTTTPTTSTTPTPTTSTTPTPTCGVSSAPYPASGVFVDEQIANRTGSEVVVYDNLPVGGIVRDYSMQNGETTIQHEETGGYLFITSAENNCLGKWNITSTVSKSIILMAKTTKTLDNPCIETATCVLPLLRTPTVTNGGATLVRFGVNVPLPSAESIRPGDSVETADGVARLAVTAGKLATGASVLLVVGAGTVLTVPALPILVVSGTVFELASLQTIGNVVYDVTGHSLRPEVRTSEMITRVNDAACHGCASFGPIPHIQSTTTASFSVEVTKAYARVRVYQGAVTVQNTHGHRTTVTVKAGYQSITRMSGPPSLPSRFTMPKNAFWQ
jgi:hypothetical protein